MKLLYKRMVGDTGYVIHIDSKVDEAVAAIAERVFSEEIVYSSLYKTKSHRPKLRLRCLPWGYDSATSVGMIMGEELIITVSPVLTQDFKPFYSNIIKLFKRESWPLDADDEYMF